MNRIFFSGLCLMVALTLSAQSSRSKNLIYVDRDGVIRWTADRKEAAFFGVNYTVPFAYGFRSHKALSADLEKAIDADVYHMARLGLDAFRVHVWDVEITDSLGNLKQNEHLRLFDYLIKKLKERKIRIMLTPIAFWGNGYPERDEKTDGFSSVYGKGKAVVLEAAIRAQENYVKQLVRHVNPYTGLSYKDDPDIIAAEINNEPHHSGPKSATTSYVNRLAAAIRSTGWTKPVFYNISESPAYADAVAKAKVDGFSFQWYPTGLVANREQKGNYLPHVDRYSIPFGDTIPAYRRKARMVYEFDAGDVMQPVMYPAMARSFRTAGFQWATQFAYDPLATAYGNTEYQTHYLNLAYTPAKALSLLIAGKAFHEVPRGKEYGAYPADTVFENFRVSYGDGLSEMNAPEEFYYTGTTRTMPSNPSQLRHLAGVGSSPVASYTGSGAYFLDRIAAGVWRLELMPDALSLSDPFEKASPLKAVTRLESRVQSLVLSIPDLGRIIHVKGIDSSNTFRAVFNTGKLELLPGVYILSRTKEKGEAIRIDSTMGSITMNEYYQVPATAGAPVIVHHPVGEITARQTGSLLVRTAGVEANDQVSIEFRHSANRWKTIPMERQSPSEFVAALPEEMQVPGIINYRVLLKTAKGEMYTFPGGIKGDPYAWDYVAGKSWQSLVVNAGAPVVLFDAEKEDRPVLYNPDWRNNAHSVVTSGNGRELVFRSAMTAPKAGQMLAWQHNFGEAVSGRKDDLAAVTQLVVRARAEGPGTIRITLVTAGGGAFTRELPLSENLAEHRIPLDSLTGGEMLLLPRPYPGFLPLRFASVENRFDPSTVERVEIRLEAAGEGMAAAVEIGRIWLEK